MMFKVYYKSKDGEFPTHIGENPFETPALEVLVIVEEDERHGRKIVSNGDYYIWDGEHWWATDAPGMFQYLVSPGHKRVLFGVMVSSGEWDEVMKLAYEDSDFSPKTAFYRHEVKNGSANL